MITIDTLTIFIMVALLYQVLPINTWFALARQRTAAIDLWCAGGMLAGGGMLLIGLRGTLPDLLTYPVGNSAIVISFLMRIRSLHLDLDHRNSTRLLATLYLAFIAIYIPLFHLDLEAALGIWARLSMLLVNVWLVVLLIRVALSERSRNAAAMAAVYGLVALSLLMLLLRSLSGDLTISQPLIGSEIQMSGISAAIASIVGHFTYMGLVLERSGRARATVAVENARIEAARLRRRELAASDRRRSLGSIASSLSHELSQPLTAIGITTQIARRMLRDQPTVPLEMSDLLTKIVFNIKRASKVIEQIRGFVRPSETRQRTFDLGETVEQVLQLFRQDLFREGIKVVLDKPGTPAMVQGDPLELSQILLHALRNAVEATSDMPARRIEIRLDLAAQVISLEIRDNGPGLTEEALTKVGAPFFTTKADHLGLGLAISRQILSLRGGELNVVNAAAGGAMVTISLPVAPETAATTAAAAAAAAATS